MNNSNYPAGVTDAHPHFNPAEGSFAVECGADEALVIPSFAVKAALIELAMHAQHPANGATIVAKIKALQDLIDEMEQEREYECGFKDTLDLDVSEEAHWDCPRCGNERTTDTVPEDRDPDAGWDERYDD